MFEKKKSGVLLQLLYEAGVRIGEAAKLHWNDIDFKAKTLLVNYPEKGGATRTRVVRHSKSHAK